MYKQFSIYHLISEATYNEDYSENFISPPGITVPSSTYEIGRMIMDDNTSPLHRLYLYSKLPENIKKTIPLTPSGNISQISGNGGIVPGSRTDKINDQMAIYVDLLNNREMSNDAKLLCWVKLPGEKGKTIPYRKLVHKNKSDNISNEDFRKFSKNLFDILDPKTTKQLQFGDRFTTLNTRYAAGSVGKDIVNKIGQDSHSKSYSNNKWKMNLNSKITDAFRRIHKSGILSDNPYLSKVSDLSINVPNIIYVPYSYINSLGTSNNREEQLSYLTFIKYLLNGNMFYNLNKEEDIKVYNYFLNNINKLMSNYSETETSLNEEQMEILRILTNAPNIEDRKAIYNKILLPKLDGITIDIDPETFIPKKDNLGNYIVKYPEKEIPPEEQLNIKFNEIYDNPDEQTKNDIIGNIKAEFGYSDEEWNNLNVEDKISDLQYYKYEYMTEEVDDNQVLTDKFKEIYGSEYNMNDIIQQIKKEYYISEDEWEDMDIDDKIDNMQEYKKWFIGNKRQ